MNGKRLNVLLVFVRGVSRNLGMLVSCMLLVLVLLNLSAAGCRLLSGGKGGKMPGTAGVELGEEEMRRLYPGRTSDEVFEIRENTLASCPTGPEMLHPPPFESKHVNISEAGNRLIPGQRDFAPGSRQRHVFVFGGSTTWGYGVADGDTIAAQLQRVLDTRTNGVRYAVFNYGVCASYSKFELRHLQRLIQQGRIPSHVVFIDGLNDFCRLPLNRPREDDAPPVFLPDAVMRFVVEPVVFWQQRVRGGSGPPKEVLMDYTQTDIEKAADLLVTNWRMVEGLCREFGIGYTRALQPIPVFDYNFEDHLFLDDEVLNATQSHLLAARQGYQRMDDAGLLTDVEHLDLRRLTCEGDEYLDSCHYTPSFNAVIASRIAETID